MCSLQFAKEINETGIVRCDIIQAGMKGHNDWFTFKMTAPALLRKARFTGLSMGSCIRAWAHF
jgi:hypothetical protein